MRHSPAMAARALALAGDLNESAYRRIAKCHATCYVVWYDLRRGFRDGNLVVAADPLSGYVLVRGWDYDELPELLTVHETSIV